MSDEPDAPEDEEVRRKKSKRVVARLDAHVWVSLLRRFDIITHPLVSITSLHCALLIQSLSEHINSGQFEEAAATIALLMRELPHTVGAVAQVGLLLLRRTQQAEQVVLFLRRMVRYDAYNRRVLLVELVIEECRRGQHVAACQILPAELRSRESLMRHSKVGQKRPGQGGRPPTTTGGAEQPKKRRRVSGSSSGDPAHVLPIERMHDGLVHGFAGLAFHSRLLAGCATPQGAAIGLGGAASAPAPPPGGWLPFELPTGIESGPDGSDPAVAAGDLVGLGTSGAREDEAGAGVHASRGDLQKALEHLARAGEALPDSTLFAACHAQLLTYQGSLPAAHAQLVACARAGPPSACAEELCLRWLQRYAAGDAPAIESAALRLLQVDPAAAVALPLLEAMVRQAPRRVRETGAAMGASADHFASEPHIGAAFAIPFSVPPGSPTPRSAQLLWLTASRVELRAHEPRSWQLLTLALGRADLLAQHVCSWWASCSDWWPQFPFQVLETPDSDMPPVGRARAACAAALIAALQASPEGAPLARSAAQELRPLLQWAARADVGGIGSAIPRGSDRAGGRVDHRSNVRRSQECGESARGGVATEGHLGPGGPEAIGGSHRRRPAPPRAPFQSSASSEDDSEEGGAARPAGNAGRLDSSCVSHTSPEQVEASQLSHANSSQQSITAWI